MRLESISLTNFLSHHDTAFAPDGRLVTVVGANGAGKSALLDGFLYALFDAARGRTDELVRLGASDMAAEVTFAFAGARYRVTRGRTTRSGGKSYLELAVEQADGSWRPLTADTIRETQAAIEALLRLDAATFTTAAFLRQGDADAFISATAAERKRILGSVLGLDVYAAAEARARDRARGIEAETVADRRAAETLDVALARRPELEAAAAAAVEEEAGATAAMEAAGRRRDAAEEAMRALSGRLAEAKAAQDELARIDGELVALRDRYHRAGEGRTAATAAIERARPVAESEIPDVDVEAARDDVARLEADAERERAAVQGLELARQAFRNLQTEHERTVAEWKRRHAAAAGVVASLEDQAKSLAPVSCPKCHHRFPADPGDVAGRLDAARAAVHEVGAEPAEPMTVARARAAVVRAESRLTEAAVDPDARPTLAGARAALAAAERAAAALAARDAATAALVDAEAALARADAELAEIETAGKTTRAARDAAAARADAAGQVADDLAAADRERQAAIAEATDAARRHSAAIAADAEARSALVRLERDQAERDRITAGIAAAEAQLALLRRLVAAFGVTGIPARIIESVLPELTGYAQELLDQLRPGMELSIRAQRAKRDGKGLVEALDLVVRDDAGERALALFSGGERMSVSLALAVGLSRLVARRAGTAVRSLVVDEPDGLDADARRAFGSALRLLAHHGELERVILVSHHEDLAEVGDAVYRVSKGSGGSVVEQIS